MPSTEVKEPPPPAFPEGELEFLYLFIYLYLFICIYLFATAALSDQTIYHP